MTNKVLRNFEIIVLQIPTENVNKTFFFRHCNCLVFQFSILLVFITFDLYNTELSVYYCSSYIFFAYLLQIVVYVFYCRAL